jgi:hypothetical protein
MVGTSSTFYEQNFRFYCIVVLRSETSVASWNEHPIALRYLTNTVIHSRYLCHCSVIITYKLIDIYKLPLWNSVAENKKKLGGRIKLQGHVITRSRSKPSPASCLMNQYYLPHKFARMSRVIIPWSRIHTLSRNDVNGIKQNTKNVIYLALSSLQTNDIMIRGEQGEFNLKCFVPFPFMRRLCLLPICRV